MTTAPLDLQGVATRFCSAYGLSPASAGPLAELLSLCPTRALDPGLVVFSENQPSTDMYLLLTGSIDATRRDSRGEALPLAGLEAPSVIGHMGIIEESPRTATCIVSRAGTVVAVVDRGRYQALLESTGPRGAVFRHILLSAMCEQLAKANARICKALDPGAGPDDDEEPTQVLSRRG